jgi:hypothetical protein
MASTKDPKDDNRWHLDKRVQISHIVATVTAVIAVFSYVRDIRQDIAVLQVQVNEQRVRDERQDAASNKSLEALQGHLLRIEDKIDRVIRDGVSARNRSTQ